MVQTLVTQKNNPVQVLWNEILSVEKEIILLRKQKKKEGIKNEN